MTTLLNINGVDYTENIVIDSYVVNAFSKYSEWTDANGTTHRQNIREKVSGSFEMAFATINDYAHFVEHLKDSTSSGGYVPTYLFVNNRNSYKSCNVYLQYESSVTKRGENGKYIIPFSVKLEER